MTRFALTAAAALLAAGPALAENHTGQIYSATLFPLLDLNGDGVLSRPEMPGITDAEFNDADANGDSAVTREELADWYRRELPEGTPAPTGG